jgi:two-component sensor histidine kinase
VQEQLETSLKDKTLLLKEIHHRVKNNLQVITSLLSLQSSFIEDEKTKELFSYSQYRINAMAVIHEMLYQTENISKINYGDYVRNLISGLIRSMKGENNKINLKINVEKINLNIDTAIPLGLLINEIVTNSLKYGFVGDTEREIYIELKEDKHQHFTLNIGDNGIGFSDDINFTTSNSLGLILINDLALQLNGSAEKDKSKKGTHYIIHFEEIGNS